MGRAEQVEDQAKKEGEIGSGSSCCILASNPGPNSLSWAAQFWPLQILFPLDQMQKFCIPKQDVLFKIATTVHMKG